MQKTCGEEYILHDRKENILHLHVEYMSHKKIKQDFSSLCTGGTILDELLLGGSCLVI